MTGFRANAACFAALCAALLLTATACGSSPSGPTSAQAGRQLSHDARALLGNMQTLLKAPAPYAVSKDSTGAAGAVKCGGGKEKRQFSGHMQVPATPSAHTALTMDAGSADGYLVQRGYHLDTHAPYEQSDSGQREVMVNKKARAQITFVLAPAPGGRFLDYTVTGTTDCLRASS